MNRGQAGASGREEGQISGRKPACRANLPGLPPAPVTHDAELPSLCLNGKRRSKAKGRFLIVMRHSGSTRSKVSIRCAASRSVETSHPLPLNDARYSCIRA